MSELTGLRIGRQVGGGGTATVHLATTDGGVEVAAKVFPATTPAARVRHEAQLAGRFDHPNVVRVIGVVEGATSILITEWAPRGSLADLVVVRGRLSAGETVTVAAALAEVLRLAQHFGVVHGDLCAANVVLAGDGRPMLTDFGSARTVGDVTTAVAVTPPDLAPEIARGGVPDLASDLFGLGSVLLTCLTGRPAWAAVDVRDVVVQATVGQWPDPGRGGLADLIRDLLHEEPARRPDPTTVLTRLRGLDRPAPLLFPEPEPGRHALTDDPGRAAAVGPRSPERPQQDSGRSSLPDAAAPPAGPTAGSEPPPGSASSTGSPPAPGEAADPAPVDGAGPASRFTPSTGPTPAQDTARTGGSASGTGGTTENPPDGRAASRAVTGPQPANGPHRATDAPSIDQGPGAVREPGSDRAPADRWPDPRGIATQLRLPQNQPAAPAHDGRSRRRAVAISVAAGVVVLSLIAAAVLVLRRPAVAEEIAAPASSSAPAETSVDVAPPTPTSTASSAPGPATTTAVPSLPGSPSVVPDPASPAPTAAVSDPLPPASPTTGIGAPAPDGVVAEPSAAPSSTTPTAQDLTVVTDPATADWAAVVTELDSRRAHALVTRDEAFLELVYVLPSAPADADARTIRDLVASDRTLAGAEHRVVSVQVRDTAPDGAVRLVVTDELPAYAVLSADGTRIGTTADRPATEQLMVLAPTAQGYRIRSVGTT